MKPVLLSGIQPSGRMHLGNYLGALKNFVDLQNLDRYRCYFFIADLHSLTKNFTPKEKRGQILNLLADYLAIGLKPDKSVIFIQSDVPAHSQLAWIFSTLVYFGELSRMTQFKEKVGLEKQTANAGLFTYPVLMAADVLLYDPKYVPVGEDQLQHLELIREIARRFNNKFGKTFIEPQPILTETPRLMSLKMPNKKMSKSQPDGCLFIDDSPDEINRKIMAAVTDSGDEIKYNPNQKAGISNLLEIFSALSGKNIKILEKMFAGKSYREFKQATAKIISEHFADYRKRKARLLKNSKRLERIAHQGSKIANKITIKKIALINSRLGLL